jgi:hypothetical protein
MTLALVWKEVREQWIVGLALALAVAGGMAALAAVLNPGINRDEFLTGVLCFAAWAYGAVCGALLLAGETEDGTQAFLDTLPGTRRRVWRIKAGAGLGLLAAQMALFTAFAYFCLRGGAPWNRIALAIVAVLYCGGVGYAWGLYCGSFARNVLAAIGWALLLFAVSGLILTVLTSLVIESISLVRTFWPGAREYVGTVWMFALAVVSLGAASRSRSIYCRVDRQRKLAVGQFKKGPVQPGWQSLIWLAWRQVRGFALAMAVACVFGSIAVAYVGVIAWPLLTLFIGLLCGITTFADEQQSGAYRLLSDQRYPLGRVWLVKSGARLAVGLGAVLLTALAVIVIDAVRLQFVSQLERRSFDSRLGPAGALYRDPVQFLALWFAYGYAVGLVFGQTFRKPLVAGVVAAGIAYPLALLWTPSFIMGGGLHGWQAWGVPAVLILATRLLMRPWAADRLLSARGIAVVAGSAFVALVWMAAALWYRAEGIPAVRDPIDVEAVRNGLLPLEKNAAGRQAATALRRLSEIATALDVIVPAPRQQQVNLPAPPVLAMPTFTTTLSQAAEVLERGWDTGDARLARFLDRVCDQTWEQELAAAMRQETGTLVDPRNLTLGSVAPELQAARFAAILLTARGLQRQADGDPVAFVDNLRTTLALGRTMRHKTVLLAVLLHTEVENQPLRAVEHWLERLEGRPELLRQVLDALLLHEKEPYADPEEARGILFLMVMNTFADPRSLAVVSSQFDPLSPRQLNDDLLSFSWQVPWESVRLRRELEGFFSDDAALEELARTSFPPLVRLSLPTVHHPVFNVGKYPNPRDVCRLRASLLQVALRAYQAGNGRPAEKLTDLVPKYLPSVPKDPYDKEGKPFRYRLSRGEVLSWPPLNLGSATPVNPIGPDPEPTREVPAGQGIIWSVGENGRDDGGHTQQSPHAPGEMFNEDVIFLVPLPPGAALRPIPR